MLENDIFDKSDYKYNSNSKLWPILAGYLTLMMHFDSMIHDLGEPKMTPLNCQKMMFLTRKASWETQNHPPKN